MPNPLVRKLELPGPLSQEARWTLEGFPLDARQAGADRDLVREGERPSDCKLVASGPARRCRPLEDGRRQIVFFRVPGDILDLAGPLSGSVDRGISMIARAEIVPVPHATVLGRAGRQQC